MFLKLNPTWLDLVQVPVAYCVYQKCTSGPWNRNHGLMVVKRKLAKDYLKETKEEEKEQNKERKRKRKKHTTLGYSQVVTDPTTSLAVTGLSRGERTGSRVLAQVPMVVCIYL